MSQVNFSIDLDLDRVLDQVIEQNSAKNVAEIISQSYQWESVVEIITDSVYNDIDVVLETVSDAHGYSEVVDWIGNNFSIGDILNELDHDEIISYVKSNGSIEREPEPETIASDMSEGNDNFYDEIIANLDASTIDKLRESIARNDEANKVEQMELTVGEKTFIFQDERLNNGNMTFPIGDNLRETVTNFLVVSGITDSVKSCETVSTSNTGIRQVTVTYKPKEAE